MFHVCFSQRGGDLSLQIIVKLTIHLVLRINLKTLTPDVFVLTLRQKKNGKKGREQYNKLKWRKVKVKKRDCKDERERNGRQMSLRVSE